MSQAERPEQDTSICIGCGFCCDGTLHGHADVASDDEVAVLAAGIKLVEQGGKMIFRQPCPKFGCGECSIYNRRPAVCRTYRCKLRKDVDEGRVSAAEAREKIASVKSLIANIARFSAEAITPAQRKVLCQQVKDDLDQYEGEERNRRARAMLDLSALDYSLERWFRRNGPSQDGPETS